MKGTGMLVGKYELTPNEDESVCGSSFFGPLEEIDLLSCLIGLDSQHGMTASFIYSRAALNKRLCPEHPN